MPASQSSPPRSPKSSTSSLGRTTPAGAGAAPMSSNAGREPSSGNGSSSISDSGVRVSEWECESDASDSIAFFSFSFCCCIFSHSFFLLYRRHSTQSSSCRRIKINPTASRSAPWPLLTTRKQRPRKKKTRRDVLAAYPERAGAGLLGAGAAGFGEAVLVHDPLRLDPARRLAVVEHERLLDPRRPALVLHGLVRARGLPVARPGGAVGAGAVGVLAVPRREEVPLAAPEEGALRQVPGVEAVQVDLGDDGHRRAAPRGARAEVVRHQLLVRRVEPEARGQVELRLRVAALLLLLLLHGRHRYHWTLYSLAVACGLVGWFGCWLAASCCGR
uniref:Uncharacterized protein n=1 Tax=Zea mays TaxID=4577 RepID=C0P6Q5_MAIZE|nr:unknown [Zea mays]